MFRRAANRQDSHGDLDRRFSPVLIRLRKGRAELPILLILEVGSIASVESGSRDAKDAASLMPSPEPAIKSVAIYRTTGSWAAQARGGAPHHWRSTQHSATLIERQSDLTLDEVVCALRKARNSQLVALRCGALQAAQHHVQKKTLHAADSTRADVARARRRSMDTGMFDPATWCFLMRPPPYGGDSGGRPVPARRGVDRPGSHGHWKTMTFVGALRCEGMTAPYESTGL